MLKYKVIKKLDWRFKNLLSIEDNEGFFGNVSGRAITIPFSEQTKDNGYEDLINKLYIEEKDNNVNVPIDNEKIKFNSASGGTENLTNTQIKFNFYNTETNTFQDSYLAAGFTQEEIDERRNNVLNSFYRIDFYDSPNQREQNFLFSEFLNIDNPTTTTFPFRRVFYQKEDKKFTEENTFVNLYFEVVFFDAKSGVVRNLINTPASTTLTLSQYNANPNWRFCKIKVLNPYFTEPNVGSLNKIFYVEPINGNTSGEINFTELIIQP